MDSASDVASVAIGMGSPQQFSLNRFHAIGFDMDHTLIRYKLDTLQELVFRCAIEYLVSIAKYPEILRQKTFSSAKFMKGVFADKILGNFLKLDCNRRVIIAYHGTHRYSQEEIESLYPDPIPFKGVSTHRFWACTSYFDMPYFSAYAYLIDLADERVGDRSGLSADEINSLYDDINHDIFKCIMYNFGDFHSGMFFREMAAATEKYIDKRPVVREWLLSLKSSGKRVFLVTNSSEEYADLLMNYAFGVDWRALFDIIILKSRKPHFFLDANPFFEVLNHTQSTDASNRVKFGGVYNGGNAAQLSRDLEWTSDPAGVLYCGDEPVGDVMAPKHYCGWSTAAIVEELEALDDSLHFGDELDSACYHHTEQWGPFFFSNADKHRLSYWGHLLDVCATVYLPCVSRFSRFPLTHVYRTHQSSSFDDTAVPQDTNTIMSAHAIPRDRSDPVNPLLLVDHAAVTEASRVLHALEDKRKQAEIKRLNIHRS